jgi:hypothetical protein
MILTMKASWENFEKLILIPIGAGPVQVKEMRRAFYSGADVMLENIGNISKLPSEADGEAAIKALNDELAEFNRQVQEGEA